MDERRKKQLLPSQVSAGLPVTFVISTPAHPSPSWVAELFLRGPKNIDLTASPSAGSNHEFSASAEATSEWAAGKYWYALRAKNADDVREIERGELQVLPDFAALPEGYDGRSENEKGLDSIKAVLAKRATQDQQRYVIDNRELWRTPIEDLMKLRAHYENLVRRERRRKTGGSPFRNIPVVFS